MQIVGWHVEMEFKEDGKRTEAAALLRLRDGTELRSHAHASRYPDDPDQPAVGEELAAARALTDLTRQLLDKAAGEIESSTSRPVHALA
ncbi:hypothetical protein B4N89_39670 [Embleya scabrispora]|uniref:DUF1876 domain-containing protein n=1 Tax=Embleya scabrispora TaxID=159449 RepID=A0A1T3NN04_9ACTN|nr:DUF1876 domain-containing protein [Embleya scabrispora]OPC78293.1 hypothetical protein B4N89_39670 [Embleya scabrispora]